MAIATGWPSTDFQGYSNHFLIAMPSLQSDIFEGGLVYLCDHSPSGAMGVMVNRPTDIKIADLLEHVDFPESLASKGWVYFGGAVHAERGLVLHTPTDKLYKSTINNGALSLTTSRDILDDITQGKGPDDFLLCLGYAGWEAGQLEQELAQNSWLTMPATPDLIFKTQPFDRYRLALAGLGIDPASLTSQIGHA